MLQGMGPFSAVAVDAPLPEMARLFTAGILPPVLPTLSDKQRQAISGFGGPVPLFDERTRRPYVLLDVEVTPDPLGGFSARIPGIDALGGGDTAEDATLALAVILGKVLPPR